MSGWYSRYDERRLKFSTRERVNASSIVYSSTTTVLGCTPIGTPPFAVTMTRHLLTNLTVYRFTFYSSSMAWIVDFQDFWQVRSSRSKSRTVARFSSLVSWSFSSWSPLWIFRAQMCREREGGKRSTWLVTNNYDPHLEEIRKFSAGTKWYSCRKY